MKRVSFKQLYICKGCGRKIIGFVDKCPICKKEVEKVGEEKVITLLKRTRHGYNRPKNPKKEK